MVEQSSEIMLFARSLATEYRVVAPGSGPQGKPDAQG